MDSSKRLFEQLDTAGRFHRDSRIGRLFHPGTLSFRELAETNSVHLVTRANRVSVHVDRVSPLRVHNGRARYSVCRAFAHNAVVVAEAVGRFVRRDAAIPRCHLDCEIVWVPDDAEEEPADGAGGLGQVTSVAC
ncbi:MAG: hypothetical protein AB1673_11790 [Actinomycetota bacterium]